MAVITYGIRSAVFVFGERFEFRLSCAWRSIRAGDGVDGHHRADDVAPHGGAADYVRIRIGRGGWLLLFARLLAAAVDHSGFRLRWFFFCK